MPKLHNLLISLVSDQRMQNVLPVFQREFCFDSVLLLASAQRNNRNKINPRYQNIATDLAGAIGKQVDVRLHPEPVDPYDPESTRSILNNLIENLPSDTEVTVNFTGGTKPMAVGAYLAAEDHELSQLYVDTFNERFLVYEPTGVMRVVNFQLEGLTIPIYLKAHHRNINYNRSNTHNFSSHELAIAKAIINLGDKGLNIADRFHSRTFQKDTFMRMKIPRSLRLVLEEASLFEDGYLTKSGNAYFRTGRWLEAFAYQILQASGKFAHVNGPTIFESPGRNDDQISVTNEIDILALYQGKLGLIECKTRLRRYERSNKQSSIPQDALSKLKALQDVSAGLFGKGFVVTAQFGSKLSSVVYERAHEYRLTIIPRENLMSLPELVRSGISQR